MNGLSSTGAHSRGKANPLYDSHDSLDTPWYRPSSSSTPRQVKATDARRLPAVLVVVALVTDILLLLFVVILEYFLRCSVDSVFYANTDIRAVCNTLWSTVFPLRQRPFNCNDTQLNYSSTQVNDFDQFPFQADIHPDIIYSLSFLVPVIMFFIGELLLWSIMPRQSKDVSNSLCSQVKLPQIVRRLYRFILFFLFGAFSLMMLVDVVKLFVGQLRPNFLGTCKPKKCAFLPADQMLLDKDCDESNAYVLKEARTSFPSMQAAISMYSAITISIYLHGISRIHHSKYLLIPFVSFMFTTFSICCGLSRIGRNHSWWTDVLAGHLIGVTIAVYLSVFVLRCYQYQIHISTRQLHRQLNHVTSLEKSRDAREWRRNRLGCYPTDSLYNLNASTADLHYSVLGGCHSGYGGYSAYSGSALPRVQIRSAATSRSMASAAATTPRATSVTSPTESNRQITFRKRGVSGLSTTSPESSGMNGGVTLLSASVTGSSSLRNSRADPVPFPTPAPRLSASANSAVMQAALQLPESLQQQQHV